MIFSILKMQEVNHNIIAINWIFSKTSQVLEYDGMQWKPTVDNNFQRSQAHHEKDFYYLPPTMATELFFLF